jgi:3-methyl-2-oxobutanoate hydroxymethyltransferase
MDTKIIKKITLDYIKQAKSSNTKITMLTGYNYPMAKYIDESGIDIILVGDSLGMVELGYESTLPVTMDEMIHHAKAVKRAVKRAFIIGDMPFMSYQVSKEEAIKNAGRFIKEGGCDGIKLEGGEEVLDLIFTLNSFGIPVMAHIGLTPQKVLTLGGYKVQGREHDAAIRLKKEATKLAEAGAFAIVLECLPAGLAGEITENISIPTIGIGAGRRCDGQVLVTYDMLGLFDRFRPKFVKQYCNLSAQMKESLELFIKEVKNGEFPDDERSF